MSTAKTSFAFLLSSLVLSAGVAGCAESEPASAVDSAALTATPSATEPLGADSVTMCHGTEPFWGITIDPKKVTFNGVDSSMSIVNHGPTPAHGFTAAFAALYQGPTVEDHERVLNVIITQADGGCSDGMSDELYPFTVSVVSGGELFSGCCSGPK